MAFAGMNYLAVVIAAAVSYCFGALYYGALSRPWLAATGQAAESAKERASIWPYAVSFLCLLIMTTVLAGIVGHLGPGQVTLKNGVISAAFVFVGFVATTLVVNHAFQGARAMHTLIDGGHWLAVLLIQGAIIGWMGVPAAT
jgi:hypothetical protein